MAMKDKQEKIQKEIKDKLKDHLAEKFANIANLKLQMKKIDDLQDIEQKKKARLRKEHEELVSKHIITIKEAMKEKL